MRRRTCLAVLTLLLTALAAAASGAGAAIPAWTTYRHDAARTGIDPDSTIPVTPSQAWQTPPLDGEVYGQPLVYGTSVYVATENDTVYALSATSGAVIWSAHLGTPEPSSAAPCGDIAPSIGITGTPVIDPGTGRIYAVGAVASGGSVHHELFALSLSSGQAIAGFPIAVDPPFPSGGSAVNQLQRPGLTLDAGRVLIGYGGNDGDCSTYWGWLVSAPTDGSTAITSFQVDPSHQEGAIWASGNAPALDSAGNVFLATGNGSGNSTADPQYGDAVVKLSASASPLDFWAPTNWQSLDASDADLGSSMPALLPGGYLFESGKDGNGYLLNAAALGHVSAPVATASHFCSGGSFGGAGYDPADATIYAACNGGLRALSLGSGPPPSLAVRSGFSAPSGATGPPMIAGGLVWATSHTSGALYGLDPATGATRSQFSIPEAGSQVNHFASPSAGGGRLFVASGTQVTAFTIAAAPSPVTTSTTLAASANPASAGSAVVLTATIAPAPDGGTVTITDGAAPIAGCAQLAVSGGRAVCSAKLAPGHHALAAAYSGDASFAASTSAAFAESVVSASPALSGLRVAPSRFSLAGRLVGRRCVRPTARNRRHRSCRRAFKLTVTYTLSAASTVTVALDRVLAGRRVGRRCVEQTRQNRRHARCTRLVAVPVGLALSGKAGVNRFTITPRIVGRSLARGRYRLSARPTAGPRSAARTASFSIVS